jgi:hypothetical protein
MVSDFCRKRIAPYLPPFHTEALRKFLIDSVAAGVGVPRHAGMYDWTAMAMLTGVPADLLLGVGRHIVPLQDAVARSAAGKAKRSAVKATSTSAPSQERVHVAPMRNAKVTDRADQVLTGVADHEPKPVGTAVRSKWQYRRRPIVEFPPPLWAEWDDVDGFAAALNLHIKRRGDSVRHLFHAVARDDRATNHRTLMRWASGELVPRSIQSLEVLARIERRYRLPDGYFKNKLPYLGRARRGHIVEDFTPSERRRLAWHLPDDFNKRSVDEQEEILEWVNRVIIAGSTDYRAFQAAAIKNRYAVRFLAFQGKPGRRKKPAEGIDLEVASTVVDAPADLEREMAGLLRFKTSTLTQFGFQRNGVWSSFAASMFGRTPAYLLVKQDPDAPVLAPDLSHSVYRARRHLEGEVAKVISLESLRLSFAMHMRGRGFDDEYLMYVLGHSDHGAFKRMFRSVVEFAPARVGKFVGCGVR